MTIETLQDGPYNIAQIKGEVDASNAIVLDEAIEKIVSSGSDKLLFDCEGMTYISSAGLGVFMSKIQDFKKNQIHFVLFNVSSTVRSVFDILGLSDFIEIAQSLTEAKEIINDQTNGR